MAFKGECQRCTSGAEPYLIVRALTKQPEQFIGGGDSDCR
jgi:hypothetical protein